MAKQKRKRIGFIVVDTSGDFEQPLGLFESGSLPSGGLLEWRGNNGKCVHVFSLHADARAAISRTDHYAHAFGEADGRPTRKCCKIVPVDALVEG